MFLDRTPPEQLYITDFSFHSIGVILTRLKKTPLWLRFVHDIFQEGAVRLARLEPGDMTELVSLIIEYQLDFDDAYQYLTAIKYGLALISFDSDFDRTAKGRLTPRQVIETIA